ncbi:MAG: follicular epithelium yolk protein subunit, partial [Chryseobacterium sp.]|nr:follicular epithelium yolk protein subunit [Chryseobacterium sp.]
KYFGKAPNDAYLHSDTPWDDLYKSYNWPQIQVNLVVLSAIILEITSEPQIVNTQNFSNNSSVKGNFNVAISQQVSNWRYLK